MSLLPPSGHCGRLGFNISIMSSTEIVVKAKLRVRVDKAGYTGRMLAVLLHANRTKITEMEVTSDWVEFSINTIVATWAKYTSHIQHDFIVELRSMDHTLLSCNGQANISTESDDRDQQPLLEVYCIETNDEDIPIIKDIRETMNSQVVTKREAVFKKQASNMQELNTPCRKHTIIITKEWLNTNIVTKGRVTGPPSIHVGVCGGYCKRTVPRKISHAIMFHLLVTSSNSRQAALESPDQYRRCCVPVEYDHIEFSMLEDDGSRSKWKIENAAVRTCGCIYYKKYQTA